MTITELAVLVADMRRAQKLYFRDRTPRSLAESKGLEQRLDGIIEDIIRQPTLFEVMEKRFGPKQQGDL